VKKPRLKVGDVVCVPHRIFAAGKWVEDRHAVVDRVNDWFVRVRFLAPVDVRELGIGYNHSQLTLIPLDELTDDETAELMKWTLTC